MKEKKQDDIILMMIGFFINEMCQSGISTYDEINDYFTKGKEKEFKKMIKEYDKLQSLTRSKAVKKIAELKKEINSLKSDIMISQKREVSLNE